MGQQEDELRALMRTQSTEHLRAKRQEMHRRKLQDGLVVPGRREQIDTIAALINDELKSREDSAALSPNTLGEAVGASILRVGDETGGAGIQ